MGQPEELYFITKTVLQSTVFRQHVHILVSTFRTVNRYVLSTQQELFSCHASGSALAYLLLVGPYSYRCSSKRSYNIVSIGVPNRDPAFLKLDYSSSVCYLAFLT